MYNTDIQLQPWYSWHMKTCTAGSTPLITGLSTDV